METFTETELKRPATAKGSEPPGFPEVLEAFNEISAAITEQGALDVLLHAIATRICELLGVRRCSVYLMDDRTGLFRGEVAHADRNIDAAIKGLTAGIEADGFTREILTTKRPVLIVNAQSDPRPVRSTMLEWNVQTMLGVPMVRKGEVVGLLFLDNEDVPHDYNEDEQALCSTFANLAATAISHAQLTSRLRSSLETVERQNKLLRTAAAIEDRLSTLVLKGANLSEITAAVSDLTGKPTMVIDSRLHPLASAAAGEGHRVLDDLLGRVRRDASLATAIARLEGKRPEVVDAAGSSKLENRFMAAPIRVGEQAWGFLIVVEHGGWFNAHDRIVARRAGTIVALEMSAERRAADAEVRARSALARDLVVGTEDAASLRRRAEYHGLHLDAPHVVMLFSAEQGGGPLGSEAIHEALRAAEPGCNPLTVGVEEGVAAIVELPDGVADAGAVEAARAVAVGAAERLDGSPSVAISSICAGPEAFAGGFREARQVARCITVFCPPDSTSVLAAADIGAARLLLASTGRDDAERFARDTLGSLLEPEHADLLETAQIFYAVSRSVRRSAEALAVHENTIRYRLGRIREMTGLDIAADADDQLTLQLGLLIMRLVGGIGGPQVADGEGALELAPTESAQP